MYWNDTKSMPLKEQKMFSLLRRTLKHKEHGFTLIELVVVLASWES
jgi:type II secretory pathway pseudopilin PulG